MCTNDNSTETAKYQERLTAKDAGEKLARLMERQLGYSEGHIDKVALRLFIRAYWSRISSYAHAIHEET